MSNSSPESLQTPYQSTVPELKMPPDGFVSNIPPHLLENCDEQTKWLLNEISKNTQATEFACHGVVKLSEHMRMLNGKTYKNERAAAILGDKVDALETQSKTMTPFFRPMTQFAGLWEYRIFKWAFWIVLFFILTYALPWYLSHPLDISQFFKLLLPGS